MDTYSIYRSNTGKAVIAFNGEVQRVIAGDVVLAATKNGVTISQAGQEIFNLRIDSKLAIKIDGAVFTGTTGSELAEALDPFFFDLEGYQQQVFFDTPIGGDTFIELPRNLPYEIGASYLLESKCYMEGPDDSTYSSVVKSGSIARCYDNGAGVPTFIGSPNSLPDPSIVVGGPVLAAFLLASNGQLFYRIQPNASAPALSCRLLFSITKF